jgi:HAD superfamily hydrolase (TIGR01509 family)
VDHSKAFIFGNRARFVNQNTGHRDIVTRKPPPFAVIFDFDGVLFETEPVHCDAIARVLSRIGVPLDWKEYAEKYVGLSDREILDRIGNVHAAPRKTDIDALLQEKHADYLEMTKSGITPIPGAVDLIGRLHTNDIPIAICSGSRRSEIERLLFQSGLAKYFNTIVATEDVAASKPSPEGYLLTLRRLMERHAGLTATQCVVIEDAAAGIQAAHSAGMPAIALAKSYGHANSARPEAVIASLSDATMEFLSSLAAI